MESATAAKLGAAAGAVVTIAVITVVNRLRTHEEEESQRAEDLQRDRKWYTAGWYDGREQLLKEQTGRREVFSDPM